MEERFLAAAFTEPWEQGIEMPRLPQHLTIFPWAHGEIQKVQRNLTVLMASTRSITAEVCEKATLGTEGHPSDVWRVGPLCVLRGLNKVCLAGLKDVARIEGNTPQGDKYFPHVTIHSGQPELHRGDVFRIEQISLVEQIGDKRVIRANLPLLGDE